MPGSFSFFPFFFLLHVLNILFGTIRHYHVPQQRIFSEIIFLVCEAIKYNHCNDNHCNENEVETSIVKSKFSDIDSSETIHLLPTKRPGLSWQLATLFIAGEVLGGGVVAIGDALVSTG